MAVEPSPRHTSPHKRQPSLRHQSLWSVVAGVGHQTGTMPTSPGIESTIRHKPSGCHMRQRLQSRTIHKPHMGHWNGIRMRESGAGTAVLIQRTMRAAEELGAGIAGLRLSFVVAAPDTSSCGMTHRMILRSRNWTLAEEALLPVLPLVTGTPHRFSRHWRPSPSFPYSHETRDPLPRSWSR